MSKKKDIKSKGKIVKPKSDINFPNTVSKFKVKSVLVITLLIIIALICRLAFLQFVDSSHLQALATSQQTLTETISAKRGNIYEATGEELAISYHTDKIYLNPSSIKHDNEETLAMYKKMIAQGLSDILELNYDEILNKINTSKNRFLVASDVVQEKVDELTSWKDNLESQKFENKSISTGISFEESSSRYYPYKTLASTVIGSVGSDNQGLAGIEAYWDELLRGTSGKSVSLKDASQSEIVNSEQTYIAAENGYDITLSIDVNIQGIVEKYLAEAVGEYECESGIAVAMNPSTGKILAMADYPNYDCNDPFTITYMTPEVLETLSSEDKSNEIYKMWKPKAVTDLYEPGSVFKTITSSIALEEGITDINIENDFNCTGSVYFEGEKRPITCWKVAGHGSQTLTQALENSCNPALMELGQRIGAKTSYKYYEAFGFFNRTGIQLPGEPKSGIFYSDVNAIKPIELAVMSFGQRFTITPIQMITAVSAIANDGVLLQPQIVDKITNTDTGEVTTFDTKVVRQVLSKETADKVASMMESVVYDGTGGGVKVEGYTIGGKTGTSEPIWGSNNGYIASFVAMSPVENTKIVLLVILNNPSGKLHNGGQIAAPTASKMLSEILPYMGIESGNTDDGNNSNMNINDLY